MSPSIIQAQKEIIKINKKVFLSPDSDDINSFEDRYNNSHFSGKGAQKLGKAYYDSS